MVGDPESQTSGNELACNEFRSYRGGPRAVSIECLHDDVAGRSAIVYYDGVGLIRRQLWREVEDGDTFAPIGDERFRAECPPMVDRLISTDKPRARMNASTLD